MRDALAAFPKGRDAMPRISQLGINALLLDVAGPEGFCSMQQARVWAFAHEIQGLLLEFSISDIVPGMNNVMVVFKLKEAADLERLSRELIALWLRTAPIERDGDILDVPVCYDARQGSDLRDLSVSLGLSVDETVKRHSAVRYRVACLGGMPGFAYLSGLDPRLSCPRRAVPRTRVEAGSVIVGGAQASIMPISAPTGWHVLGMASVNVFDVLSDPPCLLSPGDRVQFRAVQVLT